jgi:hypothetical protein
MGGIMKRFIISAILFAITLQSTYSFSWFSWGSKKHEVPADIKNILEEHKDEINDYFVSHSYDSYVNKFPFLKGYFIKTTDPHGRVEGAEFCRKTIAKYKERMSLLKVPQKYIFYDTKNRKEYCVAQALAGNFTQEQSAAERAKIRSSLYFFYKVMAYIKNWWKPAPKLNKMQAQQLSDFAMKTGGWDSLRRDNYTLMDNGDIGLIDTPISMFEQKNKFLRKEKGLDGLKVFLRADQVQHLDKEAQRYVNERIKYEEGALEIDRWFEYEFLRKKD